ncbi:hypothetical protein ACFO4O_15255 [Glaciecola siphonariae]|uniref:Uncharacterized protein n=1 Tax=Glaciecola siphonariae TaxID=521012 RepID=A0ABV9LZT7_9ALTE
MINVQINGVMDASYQIHDIGFAKGRANVPGPWYGAELQEVARRQYQTWTPMDPRTIDNCRGAAGLPSGGASQANNTAEFLLRGEAKKADIIQMRSALPLDGNKGGLPEYIIDPKNVRNTDFDIIEL